MKAIDYEQAPCSEDEDRGLHMAFAIMVVSTGPDIGQGHSNRIGKPGADPICDVDVARIEYTANPSSVSQLASKRWLSLTASIPRYLL